MLSAIHRRDFLAACILLLFPLLLFWPVTIGPNTLLPVDNLFAYEPWLSSREALGVGLPQNQLLADLILENHAWKNFIRQAIANRQIPLWNPYILSGQPFLANGQHSALYPFSLLFYVLPLSKAYGWFTVSQLWLAGLSMYIFLRTLRATRLGALIAGLTYSLSAFFIVSVVFTMIIAGAVWLPLLLAMIEMIIRKQEEKGPVGYSPIPYVVAGALVLGVQTLAGHVEVTYYTLLVGGFYALCRLLLLWRWQHTPRFAVRLAGWLLVMVLLGVGLGAVQLIPMYEVVTQNFRDNSVTLAQVRDWALPVRRIATFIIPDFFGSPAHHTSFDVASRRWLPLGLNAHGEINPLCPHCTSWDTKTAVEASAYMGILPLVLAFIAIAQTVWSLWQTIRHRPFPASSSHRLIASTCIFALLALLSLLFAFGTPLYGLLYYGLPGWNQLHSPFRWIFPYTLSIAVLAGLGVTFLDKLVSARRQRGEESNGFDQDNNEHENLCPTPALPDSGRELTPPPIAGGLRGVFLHDTAQSATFLYRFSLVLAWLLFWGGVTGLGVMLIALIFPSPFINIATQVFNRSGLAQNAFADGRQFFGYQWPNFFKFFLMVTASGAVLRIVRCPIFTPPALSPLFGGVVQAWKPLAVLIVAVDLILAGAGFNPSVNPALLEFEPNVVSWLKAQQADDPLFRINSFDTPDGRGNKVFLANAGMAHGLFDVRGYDSIIPAPYSRFMQQIQPNGDLLYNRVGPLYHDGYAALDSALLDLLGVRYILTTVDIGNPNYTLAYDDEIRVYENADALPRAFIIPTEIPPGADLGLALRSLNPREAVILDGETNGLGRDLTSDDATVAPAETGVEITAYGPNEILMTAQLAQPGWLVLADTYFPGWRAFVTTPLSEDETEVTIHRANGTFRAIYLQPGTWQVRFKYSPRSFQLGLYFSFLSLAVLAFVAWYWAWGKLYRESEADSPIKRIAKNSVVPMVMALSNRLIDFAFAMLMLRILEPEGAGRYAFAVAFIGLVEILTRFGLGTLLTRDVAADRAHSNRYLSNVSVLRGYLWLAAIPCMAAVLVLYVVFGDIGRDVLITIAIFAVGTFFSNLSDGLTATFYAHEKAEYPAGVSAVTTFTRVTVGALVLLLGWGIIGLAIASLLANLVAFVVLSWLLVTKVFRPHLEVDAALQKEMMGQSFPLMINHLLSTIFFRIDVFILAPLKGDQAVGYYSAAYKYIDGINVIPQYFTLAIFPLMSNFATNSRESLVRAYILSLRLLLMLALPLAIGTPFIAEELILFLAGPKFVPDSVLVLQLLIWFLPFSFINQVTQYVLIAIHKQRALTTAFIIGVLFNTITNLIFIPIYGYRAAAVTTVLSEWSLLIPFYILIRRNLCTVPWFSVAWRPTLAASMMGAVLWAIGDVNFLLTCLVGVAVYSVGLVLLGGLRQQDMSVVWQALPLKRFRK